MGFGIWISVESIYYLMFVSMLFLFTPPYWTTLLLRIYPMLLMALMYTVVEIYIYGFRPLLYMWWPFHLIFARFRHQWGIQTIIMDAFVTFFFLSTTTLFSVSFNLLAYTNTYTCSGKRYSPNLYNIIIQI